MTEQRKRNLGSHVREVRARFDDLFFAISGDNGTTPLEGLLGYLKTGEYASLFFQEKIP